MSVNEVTSVLILALGATCLAADDQPVFPSWVYPCPKVTSAPTIDGEVDDAAYQNAPVAGGFIDYHNPTKYVTPTTTFQAVHDGTTVYFAMRCEEPEMDEIEILETLGRDSRIAGGETTEFFLDPKHDHKLYFQWIVSLYRDIYDAQGLNPGWDSQIDFAVHRDRDYWSVELAVPVSEIGLAKLEQWQVLGFRVCRNRWRSLETGRWWSSWSFGGFHSASTYDHLVICDETGTISQAKLDELMPRFRWDNDAKTGPVLLAAAKGPGGESFAELAQKSLEEVRNDVEELEAAAGFLTQRAREMQARLAKMHEQAKDLNAGTYPVFMLGRDALKKAADSAYWSSRKAARLEVLGAEAAQPDNSAIWKPTE